MQNSIIHLIRYAKEAGCVMSVYDGGEWAVKKSTNEKEIMQAIESVDEAVLRIRKADGTIVGSADIVNGLDPDELVADHTANDWFDLWSAAYESGLDYHEAQDAEYDAKVQRQEDQMHLN